MHADTFDLHSYQTLTGTLFMLLTAPGTADAADTLRGPYVVEWGLMLWVIAISRRLSGGGASPMKPPLLQPITSLNTVHSSS